MIQFDAQYAPNELQGVQICTVTLESFLQQILRDNVPYTVATEHGNGWLFYAEEGSKNAMPPEDILERPVVEFWLREKREETWNGSVKTCCALKAGFAIIVEGYEDGSI